MLSNQGMPRARPDYFDLGHGCAIQFQPDAKPYIQWNHIDGPVLHLRNSTLEWLTLWERFQCWIGRADAYSLERKHAPEFVDRWEWRVQRERTRTFVAARSIPAGQGTER